jgi:hypothetical protein
MASALNGVSDQCHARLSFTPGERTSLSIVQEAGWAPEPVWKQRLEEESFCICRGSNPNCPVVQSVVRHCTDWATPAPGSRNTRNSGLINGGDPGCWNFLLFVSAFQNQRISVPGLHYNLAVRGKLHCSGYRNRRLSLSCSFCLQAF